MVEEKPRMMEKIGGPGSLPVEEMKKETVDKPKKVE